MPRTPSPSRGDVWLVSLDPTTGRVAQDTMDKIDRSLKIVLDLL
jgi:mRNA-degrading endonuclease toxin of MazEF toxin-antitoxin module